MTYPAGGSLGLKEQTRSIIVKTINNRQPELRIELSHFLDGSLTSLMGYEKS
jgi:hypothetical protein